MGERYNDLMIRTDLLRRAAHEAGIAIRNAVPTAGVLEKEGRANIVTAADLASEKIIMELITKYFPQDHILSEETESTIADPLSSEHLWVIDPIDGTSNFRYQRHYSAVSIGYLEKGVIKAAAVYDPFRDEFFYAEQGQGATVNDQPLTIGSQTELGKATVASDNSYYPAGTERNLRLLLKLKPTPWVLIKGSAVLTMCEVAAGRIDVYIHTFVKPWDNAAAFLLVREAGGVVKDFQGNDAAFTSHEVVVGNEALVIECLQQLTANT